MNTIRVRLEENGEYWLARWSDPKTGKRRAKSLGLRSDVSRRKAEYLCDEIAAGFARTPSKAGARERLSISTYRDRFQAEREHEIDERTQAGFETAWKLFIEFMGKDVLLDRVTADDAAAFRAWLLKPGKDAEDKYSPATVAGHVGRIKMAFRQAEDRELIDRNPFRRVESSIPDMTPWRRELSRVELEKLLKASPNNGWRAAFAMSEMAGLRLNEIQRCTWAWIDWDRRTIAVEAKGRRTTTKQKARTVPMIPALYAILRAIYDAAPDKSPGPAAGLPGNNLYRAFASIRKAAGVAEYGKPFHALRAMRDTEWADDLNAFELAQVMGHSPEVAAKHYQRLRDKTVERITGPATNLPQKDHKVY